VSSIESPQKVASLLSKTL